MPKSNRKISLSVLFFEFLLFIGASNIKQAFASPEGQLDNTFEPAIDDYKSEYESLLQEGAQAEANAVSPLCGGSSNCGQTPAPTVKATKRPTKHPRSNPTKYPTKRATRRPTQEDTPAGTEAPVSASPTNEPTTNHPTKRATHSPTLRKTKHPTKYPTKRVTHSPTVKNTLEPTTPCPTLAPTQEDTPAGTEAPVSANPTNFPTRKTKHPTMHPTKRVTHSPTLENTLEPTTPCPTLAPTQEDTPAGTEAPVSANPTNFPTRKTKHPTMHPTKRVTHSPTLINTLEPTTPCPTLAPTQEDTPAGTEAPVSAVPTNLPTRKTKHPTMHPTKRVTHSPTLKNTLEPTIPCTTLAPTQEDTPAGCLPQKESKNDPCDDFGVSKAGCARLDKKLDEKCVFFEDRRFWLNDQSEWNMPASATFKMRKACPSDAVNGAFASQVRTLMSNGHYSNWKFQRRGCQAEWDSRQIIDKPTCYDSGQWNTWIIGNGDLGECGVTNADNNKCYGAQRFDFCGLLSADQCTAAIHCTWLDPKCSERTDLDSKLHEALDVVRKQGLYFQDKKRLAGPALGLDNSVLTLPEKGDFNNGFIRMFGFKGCNLEFGLQQAEGLTDVQTRCAPALVFSSIGNVSTNQMDQAELREFILPVPNATDCEVRLNYEGEGEVFWPSVRMGGFAPN